MLQYVFYILFVVSCIVNSEAQLSAFKSLLYHTSDITRYAYGGDSLKRFELVRPRIDYPFGSLGSPNGLFNDFKDSLTYTNSEVSAYFNLHTYAFREGKWYLDSISDVSGPNYRLSHHSSFAGDAKIIFVEDWDSAVVVLLQNENGGYRVDGKISDKASYLDPDREWTVAYNGDDITIDSTDFSVKRREGSWTWEDTIPPPPLVSPFSQTINASIHVFVSETHAPLEIIVFQHNGTDWDIVYNYSDENHFPVALDYPLETCSVARISDNKIVIQSSRSNIWPGNFNLDTGRFEYTLHGINDGNWTVVKMQQVQGYYYENSMWPWRNDEWNLCPILEAYRLQDGSYLTSFIPIDILFLSDQDHGMQTFYRPDTGEVIIEYPISLYRGELGLTRFLQNEFAVAVFEATSKVVLLSNGHIEIYDIGHNGATLSDRIKVTIDSTPFIHSNRVRNKNGDLFVGLDDFNIHIPLNGRRILQESTGSPTVSPTGPPTGSPTGSPTVSPTGPPTGSPTQSPIATTTLDFTTEMVIGDIDRLLTFKGQGQRLVDWHSGQDLLTYVVPGSHNEEQCKKQFKIHTFWSAGVAWETTTGRCLIVTDNVHLFYAGKNLGDSEFSDNGPNEIESAGISLKYDGRCKEFMCENNLPCRCERAKVGTARITNLGEVPALWRYWGRDAMKMPVDIPAHTDDYNRYPRTAITNDDIWSLRRFYLSENECKDICSSASWCFGVMHTENQCFLLGEALTLLSFEKLDSFTSYNESLASVVITTTTSDSYNEYSVTVEEFNSHSWSAIGSNTNPMLLKHTSIDTWLKQTTETNFDLQCENLVESENVCSADTCFYPFASGMTRVYQHIHSEVECAGRCDFNNLWCLGWGMKDGKCELYTDRNLYYIPGTELPFYEEPSQTIIVFNCEVPRKNCTTEQKLPFHTGDDGPSCVLRSGSCSHKLRKLTKGGCRGLAFRKDTAFRIIIPSDSVVVDQCRQRCCDEAWCVAVEYRKIGSLYQECDFLIDADLEEIPTLGLPFFEIPYAPYGDTTCFSSVGKAWLDPESHFTYSGREKCEGSNGFPTKVLEFVFDENENKIDFCKSKCKQLESCLGFQVNFSSTACDIHVVDPDSPTNKQVEIIRGTGEHESTAVQCWTDKTVDFYLPAATETFNVVPHSCDVSGVKQIMHEFNYPASDMCSSICSNNPKMCRGWHSPGSDRICVLAVNWDYLDETQTTHWVSGHYFIDHCDEGGTCTQRDRSKITSYNRDTTKICNVRPGYETPSATEDDSVNTLAYSLGGIGGLVLLICFCCVCGEPSDEKYESII